MRVPLTQDQQNLGDSLFGEGWREQLGHELPSPLKHQAQTELLRLGIGPGGSGEADIALSFVAGIKDPTKFGEVLAQVVTAVARTYLDQIETCPDCGKRWSQQNIIDHIMSGLTLAILSERENPVSISGADRVVLGLMLYGSGRSDDGAPSPSAEVIDLDSMRTKGSA